MSFSAHICRQHCRLSICFHIDWLWQIHNQKQIHKEIWLWDELACLHIWYLAQDAIKPSKNFWLVLQFGWWSSHQNHYQKWQSISHTLFSGWTIRSVKILSKKQYTVGYHCSLIIFEKKLIKSLVWFWGRPDIFWLFYLNWLQCLEMSKFYKFTCSPFARGKNIWTQIWNKWAWNEYI